MLTESSDAASPTLFADQSRVLVVQTCTSLVLPSMQAKIIPMGIPSIQMVLSIYLLRWRERCASSVGAARTVSQQFAESVAQDELMLCAC